MVGPIDYLECNSSVGKFLRKNRNIPEMQCINGVLHEIQQKAISSRHITIGNGIHLIVDCDHIITIIVDKPGKGIVDKIERAYSPI